MKKKIENRFDTEYKALWNEAREAKISLMSIVENVIVKKNVIDLYPEGADKRVAIAECEKAQHSLICKIGRYDSALAKIRNYWLEHSEEVDECQTWYPSRFSSSATIVEIAYKNFWKK